MWLDLAAATAKPHGYTPLPGLCFQVTGPTSKASRQDHSITYTKHYITSYHCIIESISLTYFRNGNYFYTERVLVLELVTVNIMRYKFLGCLKPAW